MFRAHTHSKEYYHYSLCTTKAIETRAAKTRSLRFLYFYFQRRWRLVHDQFINHRPLVLRQPSHNRLLYRLNSSDSTCSPATIPNLFIRTFWAAATAGTLRPLFFTKCALRRGGAVIRPLFLSSTRYTMLKFPQSNQGPERIWCKSLKFSEKGKFTPI
jgi:hypothetical protein